MLGAIPGSTLVANWFSERRGMALGVAGMGISLSGLAMTATLFLRLPEVEPGAHAPRGLISPASSSVESAL